MNFDLCPGHPKLVKFATMSSLNRLRNFLPIKTKITLAQTLLLPILDYADVCYLDITECQLNKLERLQNLGIRFIFGLRKYDHVSEFRTQLKWLPIRLRRNTHILSLLYSILFNPNSPKYLKKRFRFLSETHNRTLRSSQSLLLQTPTHTSHSYHSSFTVHAVQLWNSLPLSIQQAPSLQSFKNKVKAHYLTSLSWFLLVLIYHHNFSSAFLFLFLRCFKYCIYLYYYVLYVCIVYIIM